MTHVRKVFTGSVGGFNDRCKKGNLEDRIQGWDSHFKGGRNEGKRSGDKQQGSKLFLMKRFTINSPCLWAPAHHRVCCGAAGHVWSVSDASGMTSAPLYLPAESLGPGL